MKSKKIYLEILRILSCFFVIARHTNSFVLQTYPENTLSWILTVCYHILSMICVPIFFMISGSLMLAKERSHKEMIKKTITRLLIPMLFFSIIIHFKRYPILNFENIVNFIQLFCKNQILGTYWFIYALMGLYLATPFLQKICKSMKKQDYKIFILYTIIFVATIPIFKRYNIIELSQDFNIPLISTYVAYYIIGNYIFNFDIKTTKKQDIILIVSSILLLIFGTVMSYVDQSVLNYTDYYYASMHRITVFIPSITTVYIARKYLENKQISSKIESNILKISSTTFGVYLIHALFIDNCKFIYNFMLNKLTITPIISLIIYQIILFIILTIIVNVMKKTPLIKKMV